VHFVPEPGQVETGGQPGGTGSHDGDLPAGIGFLFLDELCPHVFFAAHLVHGVRKVAVDIALRDGLVDGVAPAAHLAMEVANASHAAGKRVVAQGRLERVLDAALLEHCQVCRDVHVQRTGVLAKSLEQALAYAGFAALLYDMALVFVAEVLERGEHRICRRLAESAE